MRANPQHKTSGKSESGRLGEQREAGEVKKAKMALKLKQ